MNKLQHILIDEIKDKGPISVARYMDVVLGHPEHGYYTSHNPFALGDFITSPEISQIFGELVAAALLVAIDQMNESQIHLVELGPGRGVLMHDILRTIQHLFPQHFEKLSLHLVEISPVLRGAQEETLRDFDVTWHRTIDTLPQGPSLVVANEFFDVLPIQQFRKTKDGWREVLVGLDGKKLVFVDGEAPVDESVIPLLVQSKIKEGDVWEYSAAAQDVMARLCAHIKNNSGMALFFDYGYMEPVVGDTLQAIKEGAFCDVLQDPGEGDVTAHVDFAALKHVAEEQDLFVQGLMPQGPFLKNLGIEIRMGNLMQDATEEQQNEIAIGVHRLINPDQMGMLFKVIGVASDNIVIPGFEYEVDIVQPAND